MRINKIVLGALLIGVGTFASSLAFAAQDDAAVGLGLHANTNAILQGNLSASAAASANVEVEDNDNVATRATSSQGDENKNDNQNTLGETHRSAVATFVQHLLQVADREGGIGAQVRVIAQAQNDSQKTTADALAKVESRSGFKTFFVGSDYKNLGILRSQMVTTANQIDQLKKLADQTTNTADKAELQTQIQVLEQEQVKINAFITQHENTFSLFGWMFRGQHK